MNLQLSANSKNISNQFDGNELRELTYPELAEVNGGQACYKNPSGNNVYRWVNAISTYDKEKYNSRTGRYEIVSVSRDGTATPFATFCRQRGFNYIR